MRWLSENPWIFIPISVIAIILDIFVTAFDHELGKKITAVCVRAVFLVILVYLAFQASQEDSNWKGRVEKLQKLDTALTNQNLVLGKEIDSLSRLNNKIASTTSSLVNKEFSLTQANLLLTAKANVLINEINTLAQQSKQISRRIDEKTDQEFEVSGEFNFPVDPKYGNGTLISSLSGDLRGGLFNLIELRGNEKTPILLLANVKIYFSHYKFIIDAKVFDLEGNLIVQIEENKWRLNKNAVSKFNYDSSGFEIFDNGGRIALSVNFAKYGNPKNPDQVSVQLQGLLPSDSDALLLVNNVTRISAPFGSHELNQNIYKTYELHPIMPMFIYTGAKWRHVRIR